MQDHSFTPLQLLWLQEKQTLVDVKMQRTVDGSHAVSNCGIHLDQAFLFQQKLYADAGDMKIPRWAVPDVFATWNAIRNREGKGTSNP